MSLRHRLQEATQPQHARLEQLLTPHAFDSSMSYGRFLTAQAAALIPLEQALEAAGIQSLLPDWPVRRRREALLSDLQTLDEAAWQLPQPVFAADATRWGAAYVLEGSRLGAGVQLRQLQAQGDAELLAATCYLRHGADSVLWPGFLHRLEKLDPAESEAALTGAQLAFGLFIAAAQRRPASRVPAPG